MGSEASSVGVTQLGYVGIGVTDLQAWRTFAGDLGMEVIGPSASGSIYLRMDQHHHRFELHPSGEDDLLYAGWEAKDAASMRAIADQVRAQGVEVAEGSAAEAAERMVLGLVKFRDPNGIAIEVYYGPYLDGTPLALPRALSGFNTGSLGLGHVALAVNNLEESVGFYQQALGARVSDYITIQMGPVTSVGVYMHVNPRHHSLAMREPVPGLPGAGRRLSHIMVEVNSIDDVGYARGLLNERGMGCSGLGRHTNDWMLSFYVPTPSGFAIEYGCQGRTIDNDADWAVQHYSMASRWGHERPQPAAAK